MRQMSYVTSVVYNPRKLPKYYPYFISDFTWNPICAADVSQKYSRNTCSQVSSHVRLAMPDYSYFGSTAIHIVKYTIPSHVPEFCIWRRML